MLQNYFFELLQIALGNRQQLSRLLKEGEWGDVYTMAQEQALVGVAFRGVELLPKEQRPPKMILLQWYVNAERIKQTNEELYHKTVAISQKFRNDGFPNAILKGQGVAKYYQIVKLDKYRMSGDVDIWLNGSRKDIISYVRKHMNDCKIVYHHVDFPNIDGVKVEVHFTPSWMYCYFTNRKLQRFFDNNRRFLLENDCNCSDIPTVDVAFNRVFILVHIYRHLFHEGIGLRQLMDYYFVLMQGFSEEECAETMRLLTSLKMDRFVSAIMWILQNVFGMSKRYMIAPVDEIEGKLLLNEIMHSGNMGHYDTTLLRKSDESSLSWGLRKLKRIFRFARNYPSEVLWSPLFKIWHYFWRKLCYNT